MLAVTILAGAVLACAAIPAGLYVANVRAYRTARPPADASSLPPVSVLIPARDEERSIGEAVRSVLAETTVTLEVVVLDDDSDDRTADIVRSLAAEDDRVRLESSRPLPAGWCGKQYACWQLAEHARYDRLLFLDADVRLEPGALPATLSRLETLVERRGVGLLSGVPRQIVRTLPEVLLIPLVHYVLLSWLPVSRMRRSVSPAYAAGCGQYLIVTRDAYDRSGGHAAIRGSMHDGLMLPKQFRRAGILTDLVDATPLARCRMYETAGEVWPGLSKNAVEGLAHPARIGFFTTVFLLGQIVPFILLPLAAWLPGSLAAACGVAVLLAWAVRLDMAHRYRQPWLAAVLHPVGVAMLLTLQWVALIRHLTGAKPTWKGRGVADDAESLDVEPARDPVGV